jgi:NADH dehydrogenase [ubiquinone] 1 alpha subcomplex assembly factor 5
MIDSSASILKQIRSPVDINGHDGMTIIKQHTDEEQFIGQPSSYDLVYSCLSLHWINDLPGVFRNVLHSLKNDAPFIGKKSIQFERVRCTYMEKFNNRMYHG